ncbi:MAG: hypothetical protein WBD65_16820 [Methylocella sp.]
MAAKFTDRERWRRELCGAAPPADAMADLVFSQLLSREAELVADDEAGLSRQVELDVVRALLRLIFSPNVRRPLSHLQ